MNINEAVKGLALYGLKNELISEEDMVFVINRILEAIGQDSFEDCEPEGDAPLEDMLKVLLDKAVENGVIEDGQTERDLLDTKIMGTMVPFPRDIINKFWVKYMTTPFVKVIDALKMVQNGQFGIVLEQDHENGDEFSLLVNSYNKMTLEISSLIRKNVENEKSKRDAQIRALKSQINPHFLYNSLSVINWMAIRSNQREISKVTLSLSMFYRTALSKGQDMVTVDNCIQNIKAYLDIQLVMHDNDFQVIWDIDPEVKGDIVPKLLLQLVVENALEHGLDMKEEGEKILKLFFVKDGEDVLLAVEDNGPGMEQEEADKLVTYKASGYGLKNVNDRMQLLYGMEYGIKVFSQIDQGTRVEMRIPREKADEEAVAAGEFSTKKFLQEPEEDTEDTTGKKGGKSEEKK